MTTRTILASMALCMVLFSAKAEVEPIVTLNVASLEKLGAAISQLSATFEQPMLGALAMGSIQQYLQSTIGACNQAKPAAIVLYADTAALLAMPPEQFEKSMMGAAKIGVIYPLSGTVEQYLASKQLKKGADGFVDIPDGTGSLKATFDKDYAFLSQEAGIAARAKKDMAKFLVEPVNSNVLSLDAGKGGIALYKKLMLSSSASKEKKPGTESLTKFNEKMLETMGTQLDQYASFKIALGFDASKGLKFDTSVAYQPGSEMVKLASTAKPFSPALFSSIPDSALFYVAYSGSSPEAAYQTKSYSALIAPLSELIHSSLDATQPAFATALCDMFAGQMNYAASIDQSVGSMGYNPGARLWGMNKVIEKADAKGAAYKGTLEAYKKLVAATDKAYPGQKVLALAPDGGLLLNVAQMDIKAMAMALSAKKDMTPEEKAALDKSMDAIAAPTLAVLKSLLGEKAHVSLQQTPDGFVSRLSAEGADPAIARFWTAKGGAKAAADIAKVSTSAKPVQAGYFSLYGIVKALGEAVVKALPADNPAQAYAPVIAALPPVDSDCGISSATVADNGASRTACVISIGEIKKIAAAVTAFSGAGSKDDEDDDADKNKGAKDDKKDE